MRNKMFRDILILGLFEFLQNFYLGGEFFEGTLIDMHWLFYRYDLFVVLGEYCLNNLSIHIYKIRPVP